MPMLAEPRRKVKYSLNPRGLDWVNDDGKIGQKLMEKMGWSKGKGLGAKEDGNKEHISVSAKNDTKGVGHTKRESDNWLAHGDDYAALLAQLNSTHNNNAANLSDVETDAQDEVDSSDLGVKLKNSRKIQGSGQKSKNSNDSLSSLSKVADSIGEDVLKAAGDTELDQSEADNKGVSVTETSFGVQTVTSSSSITEYFAKMMALRRANSVASISVTELCPSRDVQSTELESLPSKNAASSSDEGISFSAEKARKKRKRKMEESAALEGKTESNKSKRSKVDQTEMTRGETPTRALEQSVEEEEKKSRELRREMKRLRKKKKSESLNRENGSIEIKDETAIQNPAESLEINDLSLTAADDVHVSEKKMKTKKSKEIKLGDARNEREFGVVTCLDEIDESNEIKLSEHAIVIGAEDCMSEKKKTKRNSEKMVKVENEVASCILTEVICLDDDEISDAAVVVKKQKKTKKNRAVCDDEVTCDLESFRSKKKCGRKLALNASAPGVNTECQSENGHEVICVDDKEDDAGDVVVVTKKKSKKVKTGIEKN